MSRCPVCGTVLNLNRVQGLCPSCAWKSLSEAESGLAAPGVLATEHEGLFRLNDHIVLEEIARGGMGIVYRARQLQPARAVALKMLLPHQLGSAEMRERFRAEIRAIVGLEHPAILPVYQVGEHEGMPYFTMKLATGGTLASRTAQFAGRFREIAELMVSLAEAVHFAHERGALHRDLKPGNILFDDANRPYVSDFGLAKFTGSDGADTPAITRSIQFLGTPQFLPPEVAAGGVARATTAGDLYSLGAIFYELLAGRPAFSNTGLTALLKAIVEQEPLRPSKLVPAVPHDLEVVCLKCLAKEPADRYASAREFAEDLRRWLEGRPVLAKPVSAVARVRQWARRNPALTTVSLLLVMALAIGVILQMHTDRDLRNAVIEARAALQESLVAQAALKRASSSMGQRFGTLDLLQRAATLGTRSATPELRAALRTEMAGALGLPDLKPVSRWPVYVGHFEGSAEFSRDLSKFICAGKDGGVEVYATADRRLLRAIPGPKDNPALSFRFSPDGEWIAAGFQDGHLEVLPLSSQQPARTFPGQSLVRTTLEFLPDNRHAVIADAFHGVFLVNLIDQTRRTLIAPPSVGFALAVDPAGQRVSVQIGNAMEVIRIADGSNLWSLPLSTGARYTEWSPDGRLLAIARGEPLFEIMVLDAATAKVLHTFHDHDVAIGRVSFHPDNHSVTSTSWDGRLVWRELAQDGFRLVSDGGPRLLRFSEDGARLAYEPSHGEAGIYEAAQSTVFKKWQRQTAPDGEVFMMCLSPDGRLAATSSARGVHLWDTTTCAEVSCITLPSERWFVLVLFHPDGKSLLYSAVGIGIHQAELIWDVSSASGPRKARLGQDHRIGASNDFMALEFAPDGRSLIVGENKQSVKNERRSPDIWLWPDADPARARKLAADWPMVGYHMTKDARWGLTAHSTEPDITVWDAATGQRIKGLGFTVPVNFELTPNGRWLLASVREEYQLVEIGSWTHGAHWRADFGQLHYRCWAFAPDSSLVATAAPNGRVDLRTLPAAVELVALPSPAATQIKALQFSHDGARLFMMTGTGDVQNWDLQELRRALAQTGLDW